MRKIPIIEMCLSIVSLWWAFVLFNNNQLFDNLFILFKPFAVVMDEQGWAFVFIVSATTKIFGIMFNRYRLRELGLTLSMVLYGVITSGFILSHEPLSTGTGTYFALCLLALQGLREVRIDGRVFRSLSRKD